MHYIENHYTVDIKIPDLANKFNYSKEHLIRQFKKSIGCTPHQYLIRYRVNIALERIAKGESISSAIF